MTELVVPTKKQMKAVLVRVGIDQEYGGWNAPVDAEGNFVLRSIGAPNSRAAYVCVLGDRQHYNNSATAIHRVVAERLSFHVARNFGPWLDQYATHN